MRTIHNILEADKARKEDGEAGFSLIELIIVVVILGILAAIAIPIFLNIQGKAADNAVETAAANGASSVASQLAQSPTTAPSLTTLNKGGMTVALTPAFTSGTTTTDNFCVTAFNSNAPTYKDLASAAKSGPGCS